MNINHEQSLHRIEIDAEDLYRELLVRDNSVSTLCSLKEWLKCLIYDYRHKPKEVESNKTSDK